MDSDGHEHGDHQQCKHTVVLLFFSPWLVSDCDFGLVESL